MSEETVSPSNEFKELDKDFRDIKSSFSIKKHPFQEILVYVLAVNKDRAKNAINKISSFKCIPIGGYVYDGISESYLVNCVDYLLLGFVPISYTLTISDANNWAITIPLPEKVLKRRMSGQQKSDLNKFKEIYNEYIFNFVQLIRS